MGAYNRMLREKNKRAEKVIEMGDKKLASYLTDVMRDMLNQCRVLYGREPYVYEDVSEANSDA